MISIYDVNNTDYNHNGNAVLIPSSCTLKVEINNAWVLTLKHPFDAEGRYKHIVEDAVIRVMDVSCFAEYPATSDRSFLFRIYNAKKSDKEVVAQAMPIALEATYDVPITNLNSANKTADEVVSQFQALTNKYTLTSYITDSTTRTSQWENTNLIQAIANGKENCFLSVWGGEILYNNYEIEFYNQVGGEDNKKTAYYGKNITGLNYTKDNSSVITRLYPISKDGIRLSGSGKVDSPKLNQYPYVRAKYISTPYNLVDTSSGSDSNTAVLTRSIQSQIQTLASTLSHTVYSSAISDRSYEREYIKQNRAEITEAVINDCLTNVSQEKLYNVISKAINEGMKWMKDIEKVSWSWHEGTGGWWYGANDSDYAKSQWCYIDKKWRWFDENGYWVEKWDDASGEWDWIQKKDSDKWWYGNSQKYYAHNEWIYETVNGELKKYWIDEGGWYREEYTAVSDWVWQPWGSGWWFGEEGASTTDLRKFAHDQWIWIDGNYYFFDSEGYYDGNNKIDNYAWDWIEDNQWHWFGNTDKSFGAQWLSSQWQKIDNEWYKFDSDGYRIEPSTLLTNLKNTFVTGMANLKTLCESLQTEAYTLLYTNMTNYCNKKFAEGLDVPSVTININMIDLAKTTEYAQYNYAEMEAIQLGDKVDCYDYEHDITTSERVVGLTYDCILHYNTQITIGVPNTSVSEKVGAGASGEAQPSGGYDMSIIEGRIQANAQNIASLQGSKQDKLTAGNHINISSNVISTDTTKVQPNPSGQATASLYSVAIDGVVYSLPSGGGVTAMNTRLRRSQGHTSVSREGSIIT